MKPHAVLALLAIMAGPTAAAQQQPADLIVTNARIHTVDATRPLAEALAVRGARVAFVGSESFRGSEISSKTTLGSGPTWRWLSARCRNANALLSISRTGGTCQ